MSTETTTLTDREQQLQPLFDAAFAARNRGDLAEARDLCIRLLAMLDESDPRPLLVVLGELGFIHRQLGESKLASDYYRRAVQVGPRSELASLGLFHSLVESGDWVGGLTELVRFVRLRDSTAYRELLVPRFEESMPPEEQALVSDARALLERYE